MIGREGTRTGPHDTSVINNGRNLELLPPASISTSGLICHVFLMIFKLLDKRHLKSARCACKYFEQLVSPLLFDKIYISPHKQNLNVFRQITEHPNLSRYPRELVYDVQRFKANMELHEYYQDLRHQLHSLTMWCSTTDIHHADKDIEGLLRVVRGAPDTEDYSTCRVVQRGLESYREKAEEEDHYNSSGQLLACLCVGLTKLPYLYKVDFQSRWDDHLFWSVDWSKSPRNLRLLSSPLARAWSPFHLKPKSRFLDANTVHEFDNVITAFSLTKRPLKVLKADFLVAVPYEKFNANSPLSRTFRQHGPAAMYYLENLSLRIDMQRYSADEGLSDLDNEPLRKKTLSVGLLAAPLFHMLRLRRLSLSGSILDDGNGLISINEVLQAVRLPALEDLTLSGMLGSATDTLAFLRAQPRLRKLHLSEFELSEGTWQGLLDDMRRWLPLKSLSLELPLRQDGGVDLWDEDNWVDEVMSDQIEKYVLQGGENPLQVPE